MRLDAGTELVGVVIPCLDEEASISEVVRGVLSQGVDEVVVVDNGSTDRTAAVAEEAGARVVSEPRKGYGRACAAGVRALGDNIDIICFLDGDGSDIPSFLSAILNPIASDQADFVIGSRLRGQREKGSMSPPQIVAGWLVGVLIYLRYGVSFSDMSPLRAMRAAKLRKLGMAETTYGWNLEMQMRVAAGNFRIREIPVDHRCRRGGVSKVSGNLTTALVAAWKIMTTFVRLSRQLDRAPREQVRPDATGDDMSPHEKLSK